MAERAAAVLTLPDGRWVMQRRTDDAPSNPGKLGWFGGGLEQGETPEQAVRRELGEETSLLVGRLAFTLAGSAMVPAGSQNAAPFRIHLFYVPIPDTDFEAFEGKGIEVHVPETLRVRDDLSAVVQAALPELIGRGA